MGYAAFDPKTPLSFFKFQRRDLRPNDVQLEILYCGVCHSDLHQARNEWENTTYPVVPGHEIIGKVVAVGKDVTKFKPGDMAGVGCLVDACMECAECQENLEQYCNAAVFTYNSADPYTGKSTYGGYSNNIVVKDSFALKVSDKLDPAGAAPLLCAGITTYSPMRHWNVQPGQKVGVVGLGGLGHMGVKLAHALGAHVVAFTTSPGKVAAIRALGADEVVISTRQEEMQKHANSFDMILDTVAAPHDLDAYTGLHKREGTLALVGAPSSPHPSPAVFNLVFKRRAIAGSLIGGIPETQEMLDFCAKHNITSDVETIPMQDIEKAYARMLKSDVMYRFVIDMNSL
jgi:uncharacterized zinc-type alcohol dehydrogenase-like protein